MNRRDILNFRNQMESVRQRMAELIRAGVSADEASELAPQKRSVHAPQRSMRK